MKANIVPTIVLTIICAAAAILLTLAHEATKDSISEQNEAKFSRSVEKLFGECEVTLIDDNFGVSGIEAIAVTSDGKTAVQVTADGYAKDGINILVGIDENGAVSGIEFVSLGETPGLGTKVRDNADFREQFIGADKVPVDCDSVSGATFSSKGMKKAVEMALSVYNENKEVILGGGK